VETLHLNEIGDKAEEIKEAENQPNGRFLRRKTKCQVQLAFPEDLL
jgi:hypothetical protein